MRQLKEKLIGKQNIVPKTGKGKYNVTVPTPFDFLKKSKNEQSIRAMRNEQELVMKRKREEAETKVTFRANQIPRTTTQPLYKKIQQKDV